VVVTSIVDRTGSSSTVVTIDYTADTATAGADDFPGPAGRDLRAGQAEQDVHGPDAQDACSRAKRDRAPTLRNPWRGPPRPGPALDGDTDPSSTRDVRAVHAADLQVKEKPSPPRSHGGKSGVLTNPFHVDLTAADPSPLANRDFKPVRGHATSQPGTQRRSSA